MDLTLWLSQNFLAIVFFSLIGFFYITRYVLKKNTLISVGPVGPMGIVCKMIRSLTIDQEKSQINVRETLALI